MSAAAIASLVNLLIVGCAAGVVVVSHVVVHRVRPTTAIYPAMLVGALAGTIPLVALTAVAWSLAIDVLAGAIANALIYVCFCYAYFHFNNMGETARRIRLLREFARAEHSLTYPDIIARYSAREVLNRRMSRLLAAGQVRASGSRYVIGNHSIYAMAQLISALHWVIFGSHRRNRLDES